MASVFFVHVMRTGGSTFKTVLQEHFGPSHVYPDTATDLDLASVAETTQNPFGHPIESQAALDSYISIDRLLRVPPERRAEVRAYVGHFPFVVTELMGIDLTTVTLLRDPVERTISQLRTAKARRVRFADASLEEIYEDGFEFPFFIHNHQCKVFAMERGDPLESVLDVIDIDDRRLAVAMANLDEGGRGRPAGPVPGVPRGDRATARVAAGAATRHQRERRRAGDQPGVPEADLRGQRRRHRALSPRVRPGQPALSPTDSDVRSGRP